MKKIFPIAVFFVLLYLCSCQKTKLELSPIPQDPIIGELSKYFTMPGQPIIIDFDSSSEDFTIDLECISPLPKDSKVKLGYELIDEKGTVILRVKSSVRPATNVSINKIMKAAKNDEVTLTFALPPKEQNIDKAKFIRIESKVESTIEDKEEDKVEDKTDNNGLVIPDTEGVAGAKKAKLANVGFTQDYSDYVCYTRLTDSDLCNLSPSELRVLRNTIYARHGRKFKSPDLQKYFSRFSWYQPLYNEINPSSLSAIEKHNITLIQKYE